MTARPTPRIARVYDDVDDSDGTRVLVDRLWPRGVRKGDPRVGEWLPDVAPTSDLRRWYGHDPERFDEFCHRYADELAGGAQAEAVDALAQRLDRETITLVTATKDVEHSHAGTLVEALLEA